MDERILQARVGIMVISTMLLTAILVVLFGKFPTPFKPGTTVIVRFANAPGVYVGTPVRKNGVLIGRVDEVVLPEDRRGAVVTIRLNPGVRVYDDEICQISANLIGDATLEFVRSPQIVRQGKPLDNGAVIDGMPYVNPLEMLNHLEPDVRTALQNMSRAGDQVSTLAQNLNKMIDGKDTGRIDSVLSKTERAMDNFATMSANINDVVGDAATRAAIKKSLNDLPQLTKDVHGATAGMQTVVERADRNLEHLEHLTGPLGERGPAIAARLDSSVAQLDQFMRQLVEFTAKFNNQQGTIGLLMSNPELYNQVTLAAKNINELMNQLRPILGDARVFSDKLSRDGIRGVIRKTDGTKYPNYGGVEPPPADWHDPVQLVPERAP